MRALFLAPLLVTAGCTMTTAPGETPAPERFRAIGTEPFWGVTIADGRLRYTAPDQSPIEIAAPPPRATTQGRRYAAANIVMDVTPIPCSDGMSDRRYPETVTLRIDGRELNGCGGPLDEAAMLTGGEWRITGLNGAALPDGRPSTLSFEGDRLSGSAGCNRFTGGYRIEGERLVADTVAATRMMCAPALMERETRVLALLRQPLAINWGEDDSITLTAPDGGSITLRRSTGG